MRAGHLVLASFVIVGFGCEVGPRSGRGLQLPDGDVARGALAFEQLGCPRCHDVAGSPPPRGERSEPIVALGGEVPHIETHGELVTSIINPSHEVRGRYRREGVAAGGASKMEKYNDRMTVTQLIDLTAFLQSKYELRLEPDLNP